MQKTTIKVSDLLKNVGKDDTMTIKNLQTDLLPQLTDAGVSCDIFLQATDEATILVTFENIVATSNDISDVSMKPYQRDIFIESYTVTFASVFDETEDDAFDEVFPLDTRHETIDILDPLVHAIGLEEPFVKYAPGEESELVDAADADQDIEEYIEKDTSQDHITNRITFS